MQATIIKMRLKNSNQSNQNGQNSQSNQIGQNGQNGRSASDERRCIIVVGSTGTGKSSTIAKVTGLTVHSGSGHKSVTKTCETYQMPGQDDLIWVDTIGWDDLDGDDVEIFQSILQLVNRHNLTSVRAIVWTVHPGSIRQDNSLDGQARLINQFADKEIWDNVIIVCKQAMNPEHEAMGAMKAAYQFNPQAKLQVTGYRYLEDPSFTSSQRLIFDTDPEIRQKMNVVDDQLVRKILLDKINSIPRDVQIIFNSFRCLNCGVEGDKRLLPQFCHMKSTWVHSGGYLQRHPLATEPYHPSPHYICEHPGHLVDTVGCFCVKKKRRYNCCKGDDIAKGCQERWACCKKPPGDTGCKNRHLCCKQDEATAIKGCETVYSCCQKPLSVEGCKEVCQKCGADWGTPAKECFKTSHQLTELV